MKTAWRYKRRTNRVCIFKIIFKLFCRKIQTRLLVAIAFVSYIQTRLPLITAFESLLLGHKNSFPLACPMFLRFPLLLLLLPPFAAVVGLLPSISVHCLPLPLSRNASPPSSPFDQPLSRLSLSPRFCFFGHLPRGGSFVAATTTPQTPSTTSLSLTFSSSTAATPTTTGSIEGANFLATGKFLNLSEQQLVDCDNQVL